METNEKKQNGLKKSLGIIFVYTVATGSIFTYVSYWDSVFFSDCGAGTFLAFALMVLAILPIALVYSELSPMFHTSGGELIYNTVGMNKHVGFFASWLIMAAWIAVPPAVCMAIPTFIVKILGILGVQFTMPIWAIVLIGLGILLLVFFMSLQNITFLVKIQAGCLFANIATTLGTAIALFASGHWSWANVTSGLFKSLNTSLWGNEIVDSFAWLIGMALLITPFFGFETVPQMVEEGDFPSNNSKKAICGSVITCGSIYAIFFFAVAGILPFDQVKDMLTPVAEGAAAATEFSGCAADGFLTLNIMHSLDGAGVVGGWTIWATIYGFISVFLGMSASILGFWMSIVRMLYSMGKKNFLPEQFTKVNKHQQPVLPNIFLLGVSFIFVILQIFLPDFMSNFFNLMSFGCACAYAITMVSSIIIHQKHKDWYKDNKNTLKTGNFMRVLAALIMITIAVFCTLGQGWQSWVCFGLYLLIGVGIWLWMVLVRWKKSKVVIETPDGLQEF